MSKEMSDEQQQFIEDALKPHKDLETKKNKSKQEVKIVKVKRKRVPGYKNPTHWMIAFTSIPVLLVAGFFILLMRAEQYLGGKDTLEYLVEHNKGQEGEMINQVAQQAGQGWLPGFLTVYEYRIPIVTVIIAVFLILVVGFVLIDSKLHPKEKDVIVTEENKSEVDNQEEIHEENSENIDNEENEEIDD